MGKTVPKRSNNFYFSSAVNQRRKKLHLKYFLLSVILLLLLGVASVLVYNAKNSKQTFPVWQHQNQSKVTPDPNSIWRTYINFTYRYTVQYPPDFYIPKDIPQYMPESNGGIIFSSTGSYSSFEKTPILLGVIVVNTSNPSQEYITSLTEGNLQSKIIKHNGNTYILFAGGALGDGGGMPETTRQRAINLFNQMLPTFKFRDKDQINSYVPGEILVQFKTNNPDDIAALFKKYNLKYTLTIGTSNPLPALAKVEVPIGEELQWITIFKREPIVLTADYNNRGQLNSSNTKANEYK
jgi:hypothetical protein